MTEGTQLRLIYRKDGARYRLNFSRDGKLTPIEAEDESGGWKPVAGDIASRFPARIYSQKQIYELAERPAALLRIIDQSPMVNRAGWDEEWKVAKARFRDLSAKIRELEISVAGEARLRGELDDANRKLQLLESAANREVLASYQRLRRQERAIEDLTEGLQGVVRRVAATSFEIKPPELDASDFDPGLDADILGEVRKLAEGIRTLEAAVEKTAAEAASLAEAWRHTTTTSLWTERLRAAQSAYAELVEKLRQQDVKDPAEFGQRLKERQTLEQRLKALVGQQAELRNLRVQRGAALTELAALRDKLTQRRNEFLRSVLQSNAHVQIAVVPGGDDEGAVAEFRRLTRCEEGNWGAELLDFAAKDGGLLRGLYSAAAQPAVDFSKQLAAVKARTRALSSGIATPADLKGVGSWFSKRLARLQADELDEIDAWFPDDTLNTTYRSKAGAAFRPLTQGSPGQKTSALLVFLLSYGNEPILLDQPEDDLDNQLIYGLITQQLIENKRRRQVIVVTHNANIVVNGDAELVVALESRGGQTEVQASGSLQEESVRRTICDVMEGGRDAFELRYRRIKEGLADV